MHQHTRKVIATVTSCPCARAELVVSVADEIEEEEEGGVLGG